MDTPQSCVSITTTITPPHYGVRRTLLLLWLCLHFLPFAQVYAPLSWTFRMASTRVFRCETSRSVTEWCILYDSADLARSVVQFATTVLLELRSCHHIPSSRLPI